MCHSCWLQFLCNASGVIACCAVDALLLLIPGCSTVSAAAAAELRAQQGRVRLEWGSVQVLSVPHLWYQSSLLWCASSPAHVLLYVHRLLQSGTLHALGAVTAAQCSMPHGGCLRVLAVYCCITTACAGMTSRANVFVYVRASVCNNERPIGKTSAHVPAAHAHRQRS
jgi:hypothetical protein